MRSKKKENEDAAAEEEEKKLNENLLLVKDNSYLPKTSIYVCVCQSRFYIECHPSALLRYFNIRIIRTANWTQCVCVYVLTSLLVLFQ